MTQYLVASIMQTDPVTVTRDTPIRVAAALLVENGAITAPVTSDGIRLDGILTEKDCFRPALHASYHQDWIGSVEDFMSGEVVTIDAGQDIVWAAELFLKHPYHVLPVTDRDRLVGLLHRSDVLKLLTRNG